MAWRAAFIGAPLLQRLDRDPEPPGRLPYIEELMSCHGSLRRAKHVAQADSRPRSDPCDTPPRLAPACGDLARGSWLVEERRIFRSFRTVGPAMRDRGGLVGRGQQLTVEGARCQCLATLVDVLACHLQLANDLLAALTYVIIAPPRASSPWLRIARRVHAQRFLRVMIADRLRVSDAKSPVSRGDPCPR
jgi:hypothetical protein